MPILESGQETLRLRPQDCRGESRVIVEPILAELERRQAAQAPIRVGVIGTGFFGTGAVRQLVRVAGVNPAVVANRTIEKAVGALLAAGIDPA